MEYILILWQQRHKVWAEFSIYFKDKYLFADVHVLNYVSPKLNRFNLILKFKLDLNLHRHVYSHSLSLCLIAALTYHDRDSDYWISECHTRLKTGMYLNISSARPIRYPTFICVLFPGDRAFSCFKYFWLSEWINPVWENMTAQWQSVKRGDKTTLTLRGNNFMFKFR